MAWTSPKTWAVGDVLSASDMNTYVRDNAIYLLSGRVQSYQRSAGSYTTTSATLVDVDSTNLSFTKTFVSTKVLAIFTGAYANTSISVANFIGINVDGTDYETEWVDAIASIPYGFTVAVFPTLSLASHTIKARFRTASGTLTIYGTGANQSAMIVAEIG